MIDKKITFLDWESENPHEMREVIWKKDVKMNDDIDEEWCKQFFFKGKDPNPPIGPEKPEKV